MSHIVFPWGKSTRFNLTLRPLGYRRSRVSAQGLEWRGAVISTYLHEGRGGVERPVVMEGLCISQSLRKVVYAPKVPYPP